MLDDTFICMSPPPARLGAVPLSSLRPQHRAVMAGMEGSVSGDMTVIHLFMGYLLKTHCVPGIVLRA